MEPEILGDVSWYQQGDCKCRFYIRTTSKHNFNNQLSQCNGILDLVKYTSPHIYVDEGLSGKILERPALQKLLKDANNKDIVIVSNLSRLATGPGPAKEIYKILLEKKVRVHYSDFDFHGALLNRPYREVLKIDKRKKVYRTLLKINTSRNLPKTTRRRNPTYGWKSDGKELVPVPEEQEVINRIRELRKIHPEFNLSQMCNLIDTSGIKIGKTKKCYPTTLKRLFKNNSIV